MARAMRSGRGADWVFRAGDRAILDALAGGGHRAGLREYFGARAHAELSRLATAAAAANPSGPRVLILPGIMGSRLGAAARGGGTQVPVSYTHLHQQVGPLLTGAARPVEPRRALETHDRGNLASLIELPDAVRTAAALTIWRRRDGTIGVRRRQRCGERTEHPADGGDNRRPSNESRR